MTSLKLNPLERRTTLSLAAIMALRMLGLFMILPVFALYAKHLPGATPAKIGMAMGIYGLTQCCFQIPFGMLSDKWGRKKIIVTGLLIFGLGSIVAAMSSTINGVIIGRALQGGGAVGSTIMATLADLTREEVRTKAMALVGMTIGMAFSCAFVLGPVLLPWLNVDGIFWLAALFSLLGILVLIFITPSSPKPCWHADAEPQVRGFRQVFFNPQLARLNLGIFSLHAILTASFVILPLSLQNLAGIPAHQQWWLYLPILGLAFMFAIPLIIVAEKKLFLKRIFIAMIIVLSSAEILLWLFATKLLLSALGLLLFFTAFSVLEAFLPSLVSKTAPPTQKGTALGIYSSAQFLGIFVGGALGGWLYGRYGLTDVYLFCILVSGFWATIAFSMKNPQHHNSQSKQSLSE